MPILETQLNARSSDFVANANAMRALVADLNAQTDKAAMGGGDAARAKHTARGKLLPRDRVHNLLDPARRFWNCRRWPRWACTRTAMAPTARPAPG
jgi:3-methylcrotonyl-CoA carboxylase beta subunit